MIHQLIFAAPKPGMSEADFQNYWVTVHAVNFASKIPQIKRYLIDTMLPLTPGETENQRLWSGVAEIWLNNEKEELESLQTPEFLLGARRDEPNWASFWRTIALDTDAHTLVAGPVLTQKDPWVKVIALIKRREGMPLETFRRYSLEVHGALDTKLPGLRRYLQCHVRDSAYGIGEPPFDACVQLFFDDPEAVAAMQASPEYAAGVADMPNFCEMKYAHAFLAREHWIIGPDVRL